MVLVVDQCEGDGWVAYCGDCIDVLRGLPDGRMHYSIFSPPFASLYTFSDDPRDVSNNSSDAVSWQHFAFVISELRRVVIPGRLVSVHCMPLPTSKQRDGFIGLRDFPGEIIKAFQDVGFYYHSQVCIRKDSAMSRMALADYVVTMRAPGDTPERARHPSDPRLCKDLSAVIRSTFDRSRRAWDDHKSIPVWQRYAEPIWLDIAQSDVLSHRLAREVEDERHIAPFQLTVIRRCIQLWTSPGEIVFSPFAGIGSAGYVAVEMGRRFIGVELKRSYYDQAVANIRQAEQNRAAG